MSQEKTILLVDDTADNLALLAGVLKNKYRVKVANSGERALLYLENNPNPDLILLDVMMPKLDGYGVLERLKQ